MLGIYILGIYSVSIPRSFFHPDLYNSRSALISLGYIGGKNSSFMNSPYVKKSPSEIYAENASCSSLVSVCETPSRYHWSLVFHLANAQSVRSCLPMYLVNPAALWSLQILRASTLTLSVSGNLIQVVLVACAQ
jgi:hypothetical protein